MRGFKVHNKREAVKQNRYSKKLVPYKFTVTLDYIVIDWQ